jgi:hypothetical protein
MSETCGSNSVELNKAIHALGDKHGPMYNVKRKEYRQIKARNLKCKSCYKISVSEI